MKWIALILFAGALNGSAQVTNGLKLWYKFDGGVGGGRILDASGWTNDGVQFNGTNWITITNGPNNSIASSNAAFFVTNSPPANPWMTDSGLFPNGQLIPPDAAIGGSDNRYDGGVYLGMTNLSTLHYMTNGAIMFWARHIHKNLNSATYILGASSNPAGNYFTNCWGMIRTHADRLYFRVYKSTTVDSDGEAIITFPQDWISSTNTGTAGWRHYAVTFDCTGNIAYGYTNGVKFQTNTISLPQFLRMSGSGTSEANAKDWIIIGASQHHGTWVWGDDMYPNDGWVHGGLADVRIYDRTITDAEVAQIYNGTEYQTAAYGIRQMRSGKQVISGKVVSR